MSKLKKQKTGFTQVSNIVLVGNKISLKAKGLYAYLFSKPDGWDFSGDRIAKENKEGRKAIFSGLKELEKYGFIKRTRLLDGKMLYTLMVKPDAQNGQLPKRSMTKTGSISNKEKKVIKKRNKDIILHSKSKICGKDINDLIEEFKPINPTYENLYKNKTQRSAIERLANKFGVDKMAGTIRSLKQIIYQKYAPQITTPIQLENKLGQLLTFYKKSKQSRTIKIS